MQKHKKGGVFITGLFYSFSSSAKELKKINSVATTGMLMAVAIVLRYLAINPNPDLRITFQFIPIMIIAMLFGPVMGGLSAVSVDLIGYILDNFKLREYSLLLAFVHILSGIIYGLFLYHKEIKPLGKVFNKGTNLKKCVKFLKEVNWIRIVLARISVVVICELILTSIIIYLSWVVKDFDFHSAESYKDFMTWWLAIRLPKSLIQLPIDLVLASIIVPTSSEIYKKVRKEYASTN